MNNERCILRRDRRGVLNDLELDDLVSTLGQAHRRAVAVRDWWDCATQPTNEKVDSLLDDLNALVDEAHQVLDGGVRLV
jgi:hypothetical protein